MGWTAQGYNAQGFNPSSGFLSDYWYVENNGDDIDEVEKYHEQKPDIGHWSNKVKITYGLSGSEYFRGYVLIPNAKVAKLVLRQFNGFLCYQVKYGGAKVFKQSEMTLFPFLDLILFFETKRFNLLGSISLEKVKQDMLPELKFGIKQKFINDFEKSLDEIKEVLNNKIEAS